MSVRADPTSVSKPLREVSMAPRSTMTLESATSQLAVAAAGLPVLLTVRVTVQV